VDGTILNPLDTAIGAYMAKGGISANADGSPDYKNITELTEKAEEVKSKYGKLNEDILKYLEGEAKDTNLGQLLNENGELQKKNLRLSKIHDEMKIDVESAIARDELLRSRNTDITSHQLYLLDRPVRKGMLPYLWVISILFIGIGLVLCKMFLPSIFTGINASTGAITSSIPFLGMIIEFFSDKIVLTSLLVAALVTILFLALKVAGVFGK